MPARYSPLPNPDDHPLADNELEAAFDDSDDDDDDNRPLTTPRTRTNRGYHPLSNVEPESHRSEPPPPGAYDFENVDYDYAGPPPGSPPGPSARALPNEYGNSNGEIPSFTAVDTDASRRGGWLRRTAASILPSHYVQRLGLGPQVPTGAVGGGVMNDGVFANVTAKPSRAIRIQDGDETYLVPEESQKDAPPSYASAQADAAPPYWETTIHAPSSANVAGEMIIDSLPTGSLFSFLWNMLVSISFQFVGFLLTYLLHTTHAAKLGSRAGLGITLIQYGFALRGKSDLADSGDQVDAWNSWQQPDDPAPTFATAAEAEAYYNNTNSTMGMMDPGAVPPDAAYMLGDSTSEWLSFVLMTVGWFILLTSLLGFWRVKRWERGILSSQHAPPPPQEPAQRAAAMLRFERAFGLNGLTDGSLIRNGLGLGAARMPSEAHGPAEAEVEAEDLDVQVYPERPQRGEYILPIDPNDPDRNARLAMAFAEEARLHQELRAAGLL